MKTLCIVGLLFASLMQPRSQATRDPSKAEPVVDSSTFSRVSHAEVDSLRAQVHLLQDKQMQQYLSVLEKTNQQLSLWFNPYAIVIASLAVMFALLTIFASVIIYRQSKDYKERLDALVASYKAVLDKFVKEWQAKLSEIDKEIEGRQAQLSSAGEAQKKSIEEEIAKLKAEKDSVNSEITSVVASTPSSTVLGGILGLQTNKYHKCSQCGWGFMTTVPRSRIKGITFNIGTVECPKCHNIDQINY